jgi:hypothetical protein
LERSCAAATRWGTTGRVVGIDVDPLKMSLAEEEPARRIIGNLLRPLLDLRAHGRYVPSSAAWIDR